MFSFFEKIINPYPPQEPVQAPQGLWAFCRHYTKGMFAPLMAMTVLTAVLAIFEVYLFGFMGQLVDMLIDNDLNSLLDEKGTALYFIGFMLLVGMPALVFLHATVIHQALMGNYPMSIRWLAHRYLLKQLSLIHI